LSKASLSDWIVKEDLIRAAPATDRSIHPGPVSVNAALEALVLAKIVEARSAPQPMRICRQTIILFALSINPQFEGADMQRLTHWVGNFLRRHRHILSWRVVSSTSAIAGLINSEQVRCTAHTVACPGVAHAPADVVGLAVSTGVRGSRRAARHR
jgi:hypothetical protein